MRLGVGESGDYSLELIRKYYIIMRGIREKKVNDTIVNKNRIQKTKINELILI